MGREQTGDEEEEGQCGGRDLEEEVARGRRGNAETPRHAGQNA